MPAIEILKIRNVTNEVLEILLAAKQSLSLHEIRKQLPTANESELRQAVNRLLDSQEAVVKADNTIEAQTANVRRRASLRG